MSLHMAKVAVALLFRCEVDFGCQLELKIHVEVPKLGLKLRLRSHIQPFHQAAKSTTSFLSKQQFQLHVNFF